MGSRLPCRKPSRPNDFSPLGGSVLNPKILGTWVLNVALPPKADKQSRFNFRLPAKLRRVFFLI